MKELSQIEFPNVGQTIILKENFGKKKFRKLVCTIEGIYNTHILVKHKNSTARESFLKSDFFTGHLEYEKIS